jgi:hypothetical protein
MTDDLDKPKIIVDEDWKSQVQAEKDVARTGAASGQSPQPSADTIKSPDSAASPVGAKSPPKLDDIPLPPPSLAFLCTTLATQAMIALGQIPNPLTGETELRRIQAKHHIDTLGMLEEKTKGNRTAEESALFDDLLHQLRLAFVMVES